MQHEKSSFRHESLQDAESIQSILQAISKGLSKHKLTFSDEDGELTLEPKGLLNLKLTASLEEGRHRLNVRISWQEEEKRSKKVLKVK